MTSHSNKEAEVEEIDQGILDRRRKEHPDFEEGEG